MVRDEAEDSGGPEATRRDVLGLFAASILPSPDLSGSSPKTKSEQRVYAIPTSETHGEKRRKLYLLRDTDKGFQVGGLQGFSDPFDHPEEAFEQVLSRDGPQIYPMHVRGPEFTPLGHEELIEEVAEPDYALEVFRDRMMAMLHREPEPLSSKLSGLVDEEHRELADDLAEFTGADSVEELRTELSGLDRATSRLMNTCMRKEVISTL